MAESTVRDPLDVSATPIPLPQTGALTPQDESPEDVESLATPPISPEMGLGPTIAQHQIAAGQINHGEARDWAENTVAGVQASLAGFGAGGVAPAGSGALRGVGAAARQGQENRQQQAALKQRQQLAERQQATEEQKAAAQIAYQNAERFHIERMTRNEDRETQQKMVDRDVTAAQPFLENGIPSYGEHLTSDDLMRMLKAGPSGKSEINGHEVIPLRDGMTDVIGPDGRPSLDADGIAQQRPTYRLFDAHGTVTLDEKEAKLIGENTHYPKPVPGQQIGVAEFTTLHNLATKNAAFADSVAKVQAATAKDVAEGEKAKEETKDKQEDRALQQQAAKLFTPYLSAAHGDPWRGIQIMAKDRANAGALGIVEQAYGPGKIEEWHQKQEEIGLRAEELKQKKQSQLDFVGDQNAPTSAAFLSSLPPESQSIVKLIHEGRAPLHNPAYLLARKPEVLAAVERAYPGEFDASKVEGYQNAYKEFTSEKSNSAGGQLQAGANLLQHLAQLKQMNDANPVAVRIPGKAAYNAYETLANTASDEIANFYGEAKTNETSKRNINNLTREVNRDAGIREVASAMGVKLDDMEQTWVNAAPSAVYQAPMPKINAGAKQARAFLDPAYARKVAAPTVSITGPNGEKMILQNGQWIPAPKVVQ